MSQTYLRAKTVGGEQDRDWTKHLPWKTVSYNKFSQHGVKCKGFRTKLDEWHFAEAGMRCLLNRDKSSLNDWHKGAFCLQNAISVICFLSERD